MTQQQLADQLQVSRSAVSNWEIGRNYPDIQLIVDLAKIFDVSLDYLLGDKELVEKIADDTKVRRRQRKKIILLTISLVAALLLLLLIGKETVLNSRISRAAEIETASLSKDGKLVVETNIPKYMTISGGMISSGRQPWELEVGINKQLDLSLTHQTKFELDVPEEMLQGIAGLSIVDRAHNVIQIIELPK